MASSNDGSVAAVLSARPPAARGLTNSLGSISPRQVVRWRLLTLASAEYLPLLSYTVGVLESFGHNRSAFAVGCADVTCPSFCASIGVDAIRQGADAASTRQRVGTLKFSMLLATLRRGHHAFCFDLDVFFFSDPVHPIHVVQRLREGFEVVVQGQYGSNRTGGKVVEQDNFGLFAMPPSSLPAAQAMLARYETSCKYEASCKWDQGIFNHETSKMRRAYLPPPLKVVGIQSNRMHR